MKSLYDDNFKYTNEAKELDDKARALCKSVFEEFFNKGFSPREISKIMKDSIMDIELETVIRRGINK